MQIYSSNIDTYEIFAKTQSNVNLLKEGGQQNSWLWKKRSLTRNVFVGIFYKDKRTTSAIDVTLGCIRTVVHVLQPTFLAFSSWIWCHSSGRGKFFVLRGSLSWLVAPQDKKFPLTFLLTSNPTASGQKSRLKHVNNSPNTSCSHIKNASVVRLSL